MIRFIDKGRKWTFAFMAVLLAATLILASCGQSAPNGTGSSSQTDDSGASTPDQIKLGLSVANTFEFLPSYVAEEQGFFEKRNLDVEIIPLAGDAKMQEAMAAGSIDLAMGSAAASAIAANKGVPERVVAALDNSMRYFVLIVRNDITDVSQLKGTVIGVTTPNSSTDLAVRALVEQQSWAEDDITRLPLGGFQEQMAAFKTGETDGFVWTYDGALTAENEGLGHILLSVDEIMPEYIFESIIARTNVIESNPDVIQRTLEAIFEAVQYMEANKDDTVALFEEKMGFEQEIGAKVYDFIMPYMSKDGDWDDKSMRGVAESLVTQGAVEEAPDLESFTIRQFVPVTID